MTSGSASPTVTGTVIAVRPRLVQVRVGRRDITCDVRKGLLQGVRGQRKLIAVGDRVKLAVGASGRGVLHELLERRSKISRVGSVRPRREHVIAANVDMMVAMQAVNLPRFNRRGLDRLLVLGEAGGVCCAVCLNKVDLVEKSAELDPLATYRAIGYPVFQTSAIRGDGLSELHAFLRGKSSLIIGPSGVGKSTLLNRLIPGIELRTAAVSAATRRGVHVTSRIEYLELPEGGVVLDSPGIRSIQPWTSPQELAWHFPEMRRLIGSCRFRDCLHRGEPGCAILRAITEGVIDAARHKSYLRILAGLIAEGPGASVRPRSEGK